MFKDYLSLYFAVRQIFRRKDINMQLLTNIKHRKLSVHESFPFTINKVLQVCQRINWAILELNEKDPFTLHFVSPINIYRQLIQNVHDLSHLLPI